MHGELTRRETEETTKRFSLDLNFDTWDTEGKVLGGAAQYPLERKLIFTATVRWEDLTGEAADFDIEGTTFRAREKRLDIHLGAYMPQLPSGWTGALEFSFRRTDQLRADIVAEAQSDLDTWNSGVMVELGRWFGERWSFSLRYARSIHTSRGAIPRPEAMGPGYAELIAPELALYATESQPQLARLVTRCQASNAMALFLHGSYSSLAATAGAGAAPIPLAPKGSRTSWGITLGLVMGAVGGG